MDAPIVLKPIPSQVINEGAAFGPVDLSAYLGTIDGVGMVTFQVGLMQGGGLPRGLIGTSDGQLTGIPAKGTEGEYEVKVVATNEAGSVEASFPLTIKPALIAAGTAAELDLLKSEVWHAIDNNLERPVIQGLLDRAITPLDIYYLLERWGTLTIYDAFNLDTPGDKVPLVLKGVSEHFNVYDRGSCLVAAPKDLFSYERTVDDGLRTARALAREAYQRNWVVELVGFEKYVRSAWVELQLLGDRFGRAAEIINYNASVHDMQVYQTQAINQPINPEPE